MSKRLTTFSLVFVLVIAFALPIVAQANDTASMEVIYIVPEPSPTPEPPPVPTSPDYIINIPASITLIGHMEYDYADITWVNNNVVEGEYLSVYIDGAQSFIDGVFYLIIGDGGTPSQRVACSIWRGATGHFYTDGVQGTGNILVAEFYPGHMMQVASLYGRLTFSLVHSLQNVPGTYTGTIHFVIEFKR